MKFRIRFAHQVVGLFVLLAFAFVLFILISMGINQRWFARNYQFHSVFPTAEGLSVGMSISYKGFNIGKITDIVLQEGDEVRVGFYIQDTFYDRVYENSILQLVTSPIGLGGGMVFHPGRFPTDPLPEGTLIPAINSKDGQRIVGEGLASITSSGDSITQIIAQVDPLLRNVNTLLLSVTTTLDTVNAALAGTDQGPIGQTLNTLAAVVQGTDSGPIGRTLNTLAGVVDGTDTGPLGQTLNTVASAVQGTDEGPIGQSLLHVQTLLSELETTLAVLNAHADLILADVAGITNNIEATTAELRDPTGIVPRLLDADGSLTTLLNDDNVLFNQIEQILVGLAVSVEELNQFAGFINASQPQIAGLLEETRTAIDTGQDVLEGLSNNPFIRGGITQQVQQPATFQSFRDVDF